MTCVRASLYFSRVYLFPLTGCPRPDSLLSVLRIYLALDRCHLASPPAVWFLSVSRSADAWPWCLQCGFHVRPGLIFLPVSFHSSASFFLSSCRPLGLLSFSFLWRPSCVVYIFVVSEILPFAERVHLPFVPFIPCLPCCFALLLLHKCCDGLFCCLFCIAGDPSCLPGERLDKASLPPSPGRRA